MMAVQALCEMRDVEGLVYALGFEGRMHAAAAGALGEIRDRRAVEPLVRCVIDRSSTAAMCALGEIRDPRAVEPLVQVVLRSGANEDTKRLAALAALRSIGDPRCLELLVHALYDSPWNESRWRRSLGELNWHPATATERALLAIGANTWGAARLEGSAALGPLRAALKYKDVTARHEAIKLLGWIGSADAVESLMGALRSTSLLPKSWVSDALKEVGAKAVPRLIATLDDDELKWDAAGILGKIGDCRAVEPLIAALGARSVQEGRNGWSMRAAAANALGEIQDPRAIEPLAAALADVDGQVMMLRQQGAAVPDELKAMRSASMWALVSFRDTRAVGPLIANLGDRGAEVVFRR